MLFVLWLPLTFFPHWFKAILLWCTFIFFNVSCTWGLLSLLYLYMHLFYLLIICKSEDLDIIFSNISLFFFSLLFGIKSYIYSRLLKVIPHSVQFSSDAQSCRTLCDPMNRSTPDLPVHHQLLEFTQTHVHWVSDAIQSLHPLSSPSPPAFNLSKHQGLFKWVSSSHQVILHLLIFFSLLVLIFFCVLVWIISFALYSSSLPFILTCLTCH